MKIEWINPVTKRTLILEKCKSNDENPVACVGCYFSNDENKEESEICGPVNYFKYKYPYCDGNDMVFKFVSYKDENQYPILSKMKQLKNEKPIMNKDYLIYTNRSGFNIAAYKGKSWRRKNSRSNLIISDTDLFIELENINVY